MALTDLVSLTPYRYNHVLLTVLFTNLLNVLHNAVFLSFADP